MGLYKISYKLLTKLKKACLLLYLFMCLLAAQLIYVQWRLSSDLYVDI